MRSAEVMINGVLHRKSTVGANLCQSDTTSLLRVAKCFTSWSADRREVVVANALEFVTCAVLSAQVEDGCCV